MKEMLLLILTLSALNTCLRPLFAAMSQGGFVSTCFYVHGVVHEYHSLEDKHTAHTPKHTFHN